MGDQQFENYFLKRVRVVSGDVLSSRLGLTKEMQEELAANVKVFYFTRECYSDDFDRLTHIHRPAFVID